MFYFTLLSCYCIMMMVMGSIEDEEVKMYDHSHLPYTTVTMTKDEALVSGTLSWEVETWQFYISFSC